MKFGLSNSDIARMCQVFEQYPQIDEVLLYGSRAMGTYRKGSDIDITIKGRVKERGLYDVLLQLDDLMLPYIIDLSILNEIKNPDLVNHINRRGITFYQKRKVLN